MSPSLADLSHSQLNDANKDAEEAGEFAELLAAELYQVTHSNDEKHWFDLEDRETGTKYEVKSTEDRIGEDYPADGRFRVWRSQLHSLINSRHAGDSGTSWMVFVLLNDNREPIDVRRMHAETVLRIVKERGWNASGHEEYDEQHKLPIDAIFSGQ